MLYFTKPVLVLTLLLVQSSNARLCSISEAFITGEWSKSFKSEPLASKRPFCSGFVENPDINEASGLGRSLSNPGVMYTHNDSGGISRVFAIRDDGSHVGEPEKKHEIVIMMQMSIFLFSATINLQGIIAIDFEDITVGSISDGRNYVYVADFGNNNYNRDTLLIHRFEEPDLREAEYVVIKVKFPNYFCNIFHYCAATLRLMLRWIPTKYSPCFHPMKILSV